MFFSKKCTACGNMMGRGEHLQEKVEVYGLVGKHKRHFCSEGCLKSYNKRTAMLMTTRRPSICTKC